jgi:short-subunit dehydrogenase
MYDEKLILLSLSRLYRNPLHLILSARSPVQLAEVKATIESERTGLETICETVEADLGDLNSLNLATEKLFKPDKKTYSKVVFVNNAGSLGPLTPIGTEGDTLAEMTANFSFNVTSACFLTSEAVRRFNAGRLSTPKLAVVNISSLAAIQPFEVSIMCAANTMSFGLAGS